MRSTAMFLTSATLASIASLGGCSDKKADTPPSIKPPSAGAPAVTDPITNTSAVEADPCAAIPAADIEAIAGKVKRTRAEDKTSGAACTWVFGNKDGLGALYTQHASEASRPSSQWIR